MGNHPLLRIALLTLLVILVQGTSVLAGTTGRIEGKVTDENGNSLAGAKITASSASQTASAITLTNGFYTILNLSPDTYAVTATKDGFDTSTAYGTTVTADQAVVADFKLRHTLKTLGHITTTTTASVVSKTVTGDLYAVNAAAISKMQGSQGGAETLYSQNSVVASLPGVVRLVGTGGGYFGQGSLSLRGGSFDQVGYELDGVPLNRGFDYYNGTNFLTNGLESLQVYTGGAPADAGRAMSGFINEIIERGKYPGGADITAVMGSPVFDHTVQADIYGATPDERFTYYVSTLGQNSSYNFGSRSNLANYSFTVPANDPGCGQFNFLSPPATKGAAPLNCSVANVLNMPVQGYGGTGGIYGANPFTAQRDTVTNLHWAFDHNGLSDDLQALYVVGSGNLAPFGLTGQITSDPSQSTINDGFVTLGPNNQMQWPLGFFYKGYVGQPYNPALLMPLTWPGSGGSYNPATGTGGTIPPNFTDSSTQQYSIEKVAYTRSLNQSSFLKLTGYTMFSYWTLDQPINAAVGFSFYQLHDNMTGLTLDYENQVNQHNLVKFIADWMRDINLRYNYVNAFPQGAGFVDCVGPCTAGAPVTAVNDPFSYWNSVTPLDWSGAISDAWKPSDKLLFDLGLRWDQLGFQLMPMTLNGPDGIAYLGEELYGQCLNGYPYSPSDPKILGPAGNQNCFELLPKTGRDAPGAGYWPNVSGLLSFTPISPRFGTTWTIDPNDVLRFSVGRYVEPPAGAFQQYRGAPQWGLNQTIAILNSFYDGLGVTTVHDVQPEDSTNYDLSFEHQFPVGVSMKLTPFYRDTRNQVLTLPFVPTSPSFVTGHNFGNAHIRGTEFLLQKNASGEHGIGATLTATYTDAKVQFIKSPLGTSIIDDENGIGPNGQCLGIGICGYNQYYHTNYPLLDPSAYYSPSFVTGAGLTAPSYNVAWVINFTLDGRYGGFDILPTFNYQSGNPYGDPLLFPDPHCAAPGPAPAGSGCIPLPPGITARYGGNGPDPYTGTFDPLGSLKGPSWWALNLAVSRDIGHNLKASILGTSLLAGIHNQGYPWEMNQNALVTSYADNYSYSLAPFGAHSSLAPNPANGYYGDNYYPYSSGGVLPYRTWTFSLSTKI